MSSSRLTQWFNGYVMMELRGDRVEAVLWALQQEEVQLFHVHVRGDKCTLGLNLPDVALCIRICKVHKVKIHFVLKEGLPFLTRRWLRRKSMLVGIVLFIGLLYVFSSMLWQVRVTGVDEEAEAAILQAARECGLYPGAWKASLDDVSLIQARMLDKLPSMMWVGVQLEGGRAQVEGLEKVPSVKPEDPTPHNLIANKPAVIRKVYATRGQSLVRPGQVVHPGQVLISGDLGGGAKQVPAAGQVLAEVWYRSSVEVPLQVNQAGLTGAFVHRDYLVVGPLALRIWGWQQPAYASEYERSREQDFHVGTWELPFHLRKVTLYEATHAAVAQSQTTAQQNALELAAQDVRRRMSEDGTILDQKVLHWEVSHGKLYETVLTRTEEDIGVVTSIPKTLEKSSSS